MPLTAKARIEADHKTPRIVELWQALTALRSVVSFMNTGAHPDDESSAMLAAMRFRDGIDISYACSTRGEGGQNEVGTENSEALGTLRTAEMEAACDRLDLRMYWLSTSPDDTITDFGFSKSGVETLGKWGRDRILARFVEILRTERPDIICPTFLDVPGQHGHHRAMTEAAHAVMSLAADPTYHGCDLPVWQVKKLYLPAWSGAGQSYDDDLPPPPATLTVMASDSDPVSGWSFARIGQQSRLLHATQAMGRWVPAGGETDYALHLAQTNVVGPDVDLASGLARTLRDLNVPVISADLEDAQAHIEAAISSFPDGAKVLSAACDALAALGKARAACPDEDIAQIGHKLQRKEEQLSRIVRLAAGVDVHAYVTQDVIRPGEKTELIVEKKSELGELTVAPALPDGWSFDGKHISVKENADASDPYPAVYLPGLASKPCMAISVSAHGQTAHSSVKLEVTPVVTPPYSAKLTPETDVINTATSRRVVTVKINDIGPPNSEPTLKVPEGWDVRYYGGSFTVTVPDDVAPGLYSLPLSINGNQAYSVHDITYGHVARRQFARPAQVTIRVFKAVLPGTRVGYIGGGNDTVAHWLGRMGVDVTDLSDVDLTAQMLANFDTLVIGIFALRLRAGLANAMPELHSWTKAGGTLVTLYHRPWDNWDPDATAPFRLEIGQPSLRWRVTDESADVTLLAPNHPLLSEPNKIANDAWGGWFKERGLYFAKDWDPAYTPLISMHDPDEEPLTGAWLAADVGKGRHVHTSLILHHQMEKLVPGAFHILANLLAKRP
ncbi:MAG: PIG-L family deacetylase [Marinosulfonomonas sp.]|nr:PIG-L family deacetylase [Marinosulfonomonas sp.]